MVKNTIKQLIGLNNILIPFIEGLAKITEVDAKLALKADATAIPDVSDFITEAKAEEHMLKRTKYLLSKDSQIKQKLNLLMLKNQNYKKN